MKYITTIDEREFTIEILEEGRLLLDGEEYAVDFESVDGQPVFSLLLNGRSYEAYVYQGDEGLQVLLHGALYLATVEDEREKRLRAAAGGGVVEKGEFHLKAPMPGLVVAVPVSEGSQVAKGDVLVVLESMKMQNELKAPREGTVARLRVRPGDSVEQKQTLLSVV
ncbi:MAG: biotin/lipoyl-binding protein [Anaerolineales bacterium]|nr:biotin/lipoyl-binding protein [Anaerolineales bacterium]MDD5468340.1 biotin/lipoyl-binding protein [Anaerolineales bacterium]